MKCFGFYLLQKEANTQKYTLLKKLFHVYFFKSDKKMEVKKTVTLSVF